MPSPDKFLNSYISDDDFIDDKKLVGQIYKLSLQISMTPKMKDRHHMVMHIIAGVMESLTPACESCGTSVPKVICEACRRKLQGLINIH